MRPFFAPARCRRDAPRRLPRAPAVRLSLFLALALPGSAQAAPDAGGTAAAPAADAFVREALAAEARFDSTTALALFLRADAAHPDDPAILQNISQQYSDLSTDVPDDDTKTRLLTAGLGYAQRAVALQPGNAVNVLSVAICYGQLAQLGAVRTRIEYSRVVKEYAERAIALDPNYDYAHHVLGRWHYEVASLGLTQRVLVRLIYGGLPNASTAEAVRQLRLAVKLGPDVPAHRVELGFALLADSQRAEARAMFDRALKMPMHEKYDADALRRARAALAKLHN